MKPGFFCMIFIWALIPMLGLTGCAEYQVTLNEQPIYTPPPLYNQFEVADEALKNCLRQTIVDQRIIRADQLTRLVCRHAGVRSLDGLEEFASLEELDVSHNALVNLAPLQSLHKLRLLRVNGNPDLLCDSLPETRPEFDIVTPSHCTN